MITVMVMAEVVGEVGDDNNFLPQEVPATSPTH